MSETFPAEVRAAAIAVFFSIAQVFGAIGAILFGALIGTGHDPSRLFVGYAIGGGLMILGRVVELLLGVAAEGQQLEQVARPLTAVSASRAPRAPMPEGQYAPSSRLPTPGSVGTPGAGQRGAAGVIQ